jgi:hypothetical protein
MIKNIHAQLCVHRRLVCSAGVSPVRAIIRSPVAWMAGMRETDYLKPIDKAVFGTVSESPGRNESERTGGPESENPRRPSLQLWGEGSMSSRKLFDTTISLRRGGSDSTVTRAYRATGEALLVPVRNHRSKVGSITVNSGK